jgi:hypothetical protein
MSPEPEENQNDKRPLCRDIKDFESFLLFIDNAYSDFARILPATETLPGHLLQTHAPKPRNHL